MSADLVQNSDAITVRLFKLILELSDEQRRTLLKQAEAMRYPSPDENERDNARRPYSTNINFLVDDRSLRGLSQDISSGGMFIETNEPLNIGDVITILIPNPKDETTIKMPSKVVRKTAEGVGVEYIK